MKKSNVIRAGAERISANISSGSIVDLHDVHNPTTLTSFKNLIKTSFVVGTTEQMFPDFKKSQFPEEAKSKYIDAVRAFKRQDKSDLMKHLSFPLYEIFKLSIKQDRQLPFQFYDEIKDIKLHMARVYTAQKTGIPSQTWHQITCKFTFHDSQLNQDLIKYNVFERREVDRMQREWRICHFD